MKKRHIAKLNAAKVAKEVAKKELPAKPGAQHELQSQSDTQPGPKTKPKYSAPKILARGIGKKDFDLCPLRG